MRARQQALSVTDAAAQRIQALLAKRGKPSVGVRIGVRSRGCSGLSYTLEYADEKGKLGKVFESLDVNVKADLIHYEALTPLPPNFARTDVAIGALILQLGLVLRW